MNGQSKRLAVDYEITDAEQLRLPDATFDAAVLETTYRAGSSRLDGLGRGAERPDRRTDAATSARRCRAPLDGRPDRPRRRFIAHGRCGAIQALLGRPPID